MMSSGCPCCGGSLAEVAEKWSRCKGCGHRWRPPGEVSTTHYQQLIARNDAASIEFSRKVQDRLSTLIPLLPEVGRGCRVLEVGCAEGHLGEALKAKRPMVYDGIEVSRDADAADTRLDRVFRHPSAKVQAAPYDILLSFHVLEHITDPAAEVAEWRRLLAPEGHIVLEVPHEGGHPLVVTDENVEHLHQFTWASLLCLLNGAGLEAENISGGHYESAVYADSIRVIARVRESDASRKDRLVMRFKNRMGNKPFLVYGVGGDFKNYVLPVLEQLPVVELLDSSAEKWGTDFAGHKIGKFDPARYCGIPVLACSVRFRSSILATLKELGIPEELVVTLDEIYDPA